MGAKDKNNDPSDRDDGRWFYDYLYNQNLVDERNAKKYEWRQYCEDGVLYGVDPEDFETEEEYQEALDEVKYEWRDNYIGISDMEVDPEDYETEEEYLDALDEFRENEAAWRNTCENGAEYGIDPEDYETEEEYQEALAEARKRISSADFARRYSSKSSALDQPDDSKEEVNPNGLRYNAADENDKTVYTYCGVLLPSSRRPYSFRTEDQTIRIGDTVIVPVGADNQETEGKVVSIGQYLRAGVPYPVEKTKMIIRKADKEVLSAKDAANKGIIGGAET